MQFVYTINIIRTWRTNGVTDLFGSNDRRVMFRPLYQRQCVLPKGLTSLWIASRFESCKVANWPRTLEDLFVVDTHQFFQSGTVYPFASSLTSLCLGDVNIGLHAERAPIAVDFSIFSRLEVLVLQPYCAACPAKLPASLRVLLMDSSQLYSINSTCLSFPAGLRAIAFPKVRNHQWPSSLLSSWHSSRLLLLPPSLYFRNIMGLEKDALTHLPHDMLELETLVCSFAQLSYVDSSWTPPPSLRYLIVDSQHSPIPLKIPDHFVNGIAMEAVTIIQHYLREEINKYDTSPFSRDAKRVNMIMDYNADEKLLVTKGLNINSIFSITVVNYVSQKPHLEDNQVQFNRASGS